MSLNFSTEELLRELSDRVKSGVVTSEEVADKLNFDISVAHVSHVSTGESFIPSSPTVVEEKKPHKGLPFTKILYSLGAAIVVVGIIIFVGQIWEDIGSVGRIVVTFGLGILFAVLGSFFMNKKPEDSIGKIFHIIGALLIPSGALVSIFEITNSVTLGKASMVFAILFVMYLILAVVHRSMVFTFFTIAHATTFIYLLTGTLLESAGYRGDGAIYAYFTMIIGASYFLLSHAFENTWNKELIPVLNFFGALGFLGGAFSRVFDSRLWEWVYFPLTFLGLYFGTYIRSRATLVLSTIFLIFHIVYITEEYFADSIGWPISLVILGMVIIGIGYVSISISKKYIK